MMEEVTAREHILHAVAPLPSGDCPLDEALSLYLAETLTARLPQPHFANAQVDGFALPRAARAGETFPILGCQPAGQRRIVTLPESGCLQIFTGAPVPDQTAAVIMQEEVRRVGETIELLADVAAGEGIRLVGQDICEGQVLFRAGELLSSRAAAVLAGQGISRVRVFRRPTISILTTGDELVVPGQPLQDGQIYNSNAVLLAGLCREAGFQSELFFAPDCLEATQLQIEAARRHDALVIAGGVSVGERDFVKTALQNAGFTLDLWRVRVKPGKPFLFGHKDRWPVFGLPGNPVSAFVTFWLFVLPALKKLSGASPADWLPQEMKAKTTQALANPGDRPHYVRGGLQGNQFTAIGLQQSHGLFSLARSTALAYLPAGQTLPAQSDISVFPFCI